jgi:iron-sulfur cluster repair protein YtfE (RIC family)
MAHACGCHHHEASAGTTSVTAAGAYRADQKVEDVARSPAALEALKAMGINHCCGGHLSLAEAAAAAGVSVETLLDELRRAAAATA